MTDRTFTKEEVAALFNRASELQSEQVQSGSSDRPGLTLVEVSEIAEEAGLDPRHVHLAVAEMDQSMAADQQKRSGTHATEIFAERRVFGPPRNGAVEDVVAELRHRYDSSAAEYMGMPGYGKSTIETVGRSTGWKHKDFRGIETRVLLQPQDDQFRIRVSRKSEWGSMTDWTSFAAVIALVVGFMAAPALGSYLFGLLAGLLTLLVAIPLMRGLNSRWINKQRAEVEQLADSIADQVTPHVSEAPTSSHSEPAASRAMRDELG